MASSSEGSPLEPPTFGQSNKISRETSPHSPNFSAKRGGEGPNQSGRSTPVDRPRYQLWPTIKRAATPTAKQTPDSATTSATIQTVSRLREGSPKGPIDSAMRSKHKEGILPRRRKISVPELGLGLMTTVQETHMDSPTIPGRFPVHERSSSAPGTSSLSRSPFEESLLEPVAEPPSLLHAKPANPLKPSPLREERKSLKRASAVLLPEEASTLVVPMSTFNPHARTASPRENGSDGSDTPPAVPPKSPRTILRIPPIATAINSNQRQSPGSTQTPVPISAPEVSFSTTPFTPPWQSPVGRDVSPKSVNPAKTPTHKQGSSLPHNQHQPELDSRRRADSASTQYRRELSEGPGLERGRSTRRTEGVFKKESASARPVADDVAFMTLPPGVSASHASSLLPKSEVEQLQQQAIGQAERFEVLKHDDVKKLSRELGLLDERCDYLRKTHNDLRAGRRNLHTRMITYLKSPRLSKFSRESMLKQEEALAELDISIDEWVTKLEHAENRRTRVRQKLLEHVAAALTLQTPRINSSPPRRDEQTPPTSPEKAESPRSISRETVHIYADEQLLAGLFKDIEKEIEEMVEPKPTN